MQRLVTDGRLNEQEHVAREDAAMELLVMLVAIIGAAAATAGSLRAETRDTRALDRTGPR